MIPPAEKEKVDQLLYHAGEDIGEAREIIAGWPVDGGTQPVIVSFTAQPSVLPAEGGKVTLTWATEHAVRVLIWGNGGPDEYPANGSAEFTIATNTTFVLQAFADETNNNPTEATAIVKLLPPTQVEGPPQILEFHVTPDELPVGGGTATLTWETTGATMVILGETPVGPAESITQHVGATARFTLKAIGVGPIATAVADVVVKQAIPTGEWMPSVAYSISSAQYNFSPKGDYYRADKLPPHIPFTCFDDARFGIIARSANGKVLQKRRLHVNGATWQTYGPVTVVEDGKIRQRWDKHATSDMEWLATQLRVEKPRLGPRGEGYPGPYFTAHAHPNAITAGSLNSPTFMCLRADGVMFGFMPTGETKYMFTLDQSITTYHDFTLTDDPSVFFVTCAYEGKLRRVTREALNIVSEEDFAEGIGFVTSVRYVGGMLYACDNHGNKLHKINPATGRTNPKPGLRAILSSAVQSPFWIDATEDPNKIVVLSSLNTNVHYVDVNTGVVGPNVFFPDVTDPAAHISFAFGTISCDIGGTFGPKGDLMVAIDAQTWGGTNNTVYHATKRDGALVWDFSPFHPPHPTVPGAAMPLLGVGRGQEPGHYMWASEYHNPPGGNGQGIVLVWGHSQTAANIVRIALPEDPPEDAYEDVGNDTSGAPNRAHANHGLQSLIYGAPASVPYGQYPSAMCALNSSMWGIYNADYFGSLSIDERKEWIYMGFGGIHPRAEFRSDDYSTWAIGYSLLTNSQEWLRRGTACTNEWRAAFPVDMEPIVIGTDDEGKPITLPPIPSYNNYYLHAYKEGDGLTVYWQDKDTGQHPIAAGTVIDLYSDYGSPWQTKLATVTADGSNSVRWDGPLGLPTGRYVCSAIAPGFVCNATLMDVEAGTVEGIKEVGEKLAPGEWGAVTSLNIDRLYDASVTDPARTHIPTYYSNAAPWNNTDGAIEFIGADHGGTPARYRYHAATNSWDVSVPCIGSHGYNATAVDNAGTTFRAGQIFRLGLDPVTGVIGVYQIALDGTHTLFAVSPEAIGQSSDSSAGALIWCGNTLGLYSSDSGKFWLLDMTAKTWAAVAAAAVHNMYHCVAAYSAPFNCAIFGGGNDQGGGESKRLWRLDLADNKLTALPDSKHPIGVHNGCNLSAGPDGHIVALGFGEHWKLDLTSNTWAKLAATPAGMLMPNEHQAVISSCTPWGVVYVAAQSVNAVIQYQMWVYKPALATAAARTSKRR